MKDRDKIDIAGAARFRINLDAELAQQINAVMQQYNVDQSVVVRDALRWYFSLPSSTFDAGWREGYIAAVRTVKLRLADVFRDVATAPTVVAAPPNNDPNSNNGSGTPPLSY